jgi:hypothetical protein
VGGGFVEEKIGLHDINLFLANLRNQILSISYQQILINKIAKYQ